VRVDADEEVGIPKNAKTFSFGTFVSCPKVLHGHIEKAALP
jgi:hypothetical protein